MDLEGFVEILGIRKWCFCGFEKILRFWQGSKEKLEDLDGFWGDFCGVGKI